MTLPPVSNRGASLPGIAAGHYPEQRIPLQSVLIHQIILRQYMDQHVAPMEGDVLAGLLLELAYGFTDSFITA
jgi:hypothetical protein